MIHRRYVLSAGAAAPFIRFGGARAETVVRFGSVGGLTDAGLYLADDQGYFAAAGLGVQMLRMPNAPSLLTALATGQLDVAGISVTPGAVQLDRSGRADPHRRGQAKRPAGLFRHQAGGARRLPDRF